MKSYLFCFDYHQIFILFNLTYINLFINSFSHFLGSSFLLGAANTHVRDPLLSYYVGDVTPQTSPTLYLAMCRKLVDEYKRIAPDYVEFGGMPLIVNTHGWVKGMGLDLIHALFDYVKPTNIIKFESSSNNKKFSTPGYIVAAGGDSNGGESGAPALHIVTPFDEIYHHGNSSSSPSSAAVFRAVRPTASAQRTMRMIQYFIKNRTRQGGVTAEVEEEEEEDDGRTGEHGKEILDEDESTHLAVENAARSLSYNADVLASSLPYSIRFHKLLVHVVQTSQLPDTEAVHVINGSIVGLCRVVMNSLISSDSPPLTSSLGPLSSTSSSLRMYNGDTPIVPCLGLGIVRSIDVEKGLLYLLTPLPLERLKGVNMLVRGNIQLPRELLLSRNFSEVPPYHCAPHETLSGTGAGAASMNVGVGHQKEVKRRRLGK